mgnify:CR=1 FL=1
MLCAKSQTIRPCPIGLILVALDGFLGVGGCLIGFIVVLRFKWTDSPQELKPYVILMFFRIFLPTENIVCACILARTRKFDQYESPGSGPKSCALKNDAEWWWYHLDFFNFRSFHGRSRLPTLSRIPPSSNIFVWVLQTKVQI